MTSRERVSAAFAHRSPDRTPMFEYVLLPPLADRFLGHPYAGDDGTFRVLAREQGWDAAIRRNALDRLAIAEALGHDFLYAWPPPGPEACRGDRDGGVDAGADPSVAGAPDDPVERLGERNRREAEAGPEPSDAALALFVALREQIRRRGPDIPVLAPAYAHGVWTDTDLMESMALAPEVAHEHFRLATGRMLRLVARYAAIGMDVVGVGGDFAGNRPLISPDAYRRYVVPEVRRVADAVRAAGMLSVNASDGDLWPVIGDFLEGCGVDGYLEIDMQAGMDLGRLKRAWGGRFTLFGNMDCGTLLSFGTVEAIAAATRACLEAGREGSPGGHVFCASNAITASVPAANYLAMIGEYRRFVGLPGLKFGGTGA
jgi:hypothetical protein